MGHPVAEDPAAAAANAWPDERIRVVLAHELAHIRRNDWLSQLSAELLRALYWFNPLVWLASRRLREESERACDDAVLETGVDAPAYATHLLEVAKGFSAYRRAWSPAPAIASPSHLERRVRAMLNARLNRRPLTRLTRAAIVIAVVGITLPIAALAQASFSTFSGSVLDPMNGLLPKTTLVLTNTRTQAKYEVRSDASGRFEFVGLPPSDYILEAALPGFATLRGTVTVTGQDVSQEIRLNVGELEETITVIAGAAPNRRPEQDAARNGRCRSAPTRCRRHRRTHPARRQGARRAPDLSTGSERCEGGGVRPAQCGDRHQRFGQGSSGRAAGASGVRCRRRGRRSTVGVR